MVNLCDYGNSQDCEQVSSFFLELFEEFVGDSSSGGWVIQNLFKSQSLESGESKYKPVFSFLENWKNYVFFEGEVDFWLAQSNAFVWFIYFPEAEVAIHRGLMVDELIRSVEMLKNKKVKKNQKSKMYFINGFPRPYHYFYDRTLPFRYLDEGCDSPSFISLKESAFLPAKAFYDSADEVVISLEEINDFLLKNNAIAFSLGGGFGVDRKDHIYHFSDIISERVSDHLEVEAVYDFDENSAKFVWIGLCQESRKWKEQVEAISLVVQEIKEKDGEVVFVFDGLTCPHYLSSHDFILEKCSKEVAVLEEVVEKSGLKNDQVISLVGRKAVEKILWAHRCSFFISGALTDSLWPATFGKLPGVAYSIPRAKINGHCHPNTKFIPPSKVREIGKGDGNWARAGFSINAVYFKDFVVGEFSKIYG